jgi:hypothetical protein
MFTFCDSRLVLVFISSEQFLSAKQSTHYHYAVRIVFMLVSTAISIWKQSTYYNYATRFFFFFLRLIVMVCWCPLSYAGIFVNNLFLHFFFTVFFLQCLTEHCPSSVYDGSVLLCFCFFLPPVKNCICLEKNDLQTHTHTRTHTHTYMYVCSTHSLTASDAYIHTLCRHMHPHKHALTHGPT